MSDLGLDDVTGLVELWQQLGVNAETRSDAAVCIGALLK